MTPERDIERVLEAWLEPGSSKMPDRLFDAVVDRIEREPQRRVPRLTSRFHSMNTILKLAAAAVLLLVVGIGTGPFLSGPDGLAPGAQAPASPSPLPSPAASPRNLPLSYGPLEAGTYALHTLIRNPNSPLQWMTVTLPDGWSGIGGRTFANLFQDSDDYPTGNITFHLVSNFFIDPCDPAAGVWDPPLGPTVDDFVAAIAEVEGYTVTAPTDVTLLGYPGKYLELTAPPSVAQCDGFIHAWQTENDETAQFLVDGQHERVWVLDVDGTRVVISLTAGHAVPRPTGTDPASLEEQQAVFDSLRIAPAPSPTAAPSASPAS